MLKKKRGSRKERRGSKGDNGAECSKRRRRGRDVWIQGRFGDDFKLGSQS